MVRRVGIVGYGNLAVLQDENFELAFVWNRTKSVLEGNFEPNLILDDLDDFRTKSPDIIVEVSHPFITKMHGKDFLSYCDYMIGSPTSLSDSELREELMSSTAHHGFYLPSGAFWGGEDLQKMSDSGSLHKLKVTMRKHPSSLFVKGSLKEKNDEVTSEPVTLYEGPVEGVCALAPHNTNTMAVAALIAPNLGFEGVTGCLISDPNLKNLHIVEIEAFGKPQPDGSCFHVHTVRKNPAAVGNVTGTATYKSFWESLKRAHGRGPGFHLC